MFMQCAMDECSRVAIHLIRLLPNHFIHGASPSLTLTCSLETRTAPRTGGHLADYHLRGFRAPDLPRLFILCGDSVERGS